MSRSAGWYPDPIQVDTVRYFDGQDWTEQTAPAATRTSVTVLADRGPSRSGFGPGLVAGFLLPPLGFLWGLVCLMRGYVKDGLVLWLWSFAWAFAWIFILGSVISVSI